MGNPNPVDGTKNLIHRGRFKGAMCKPKRVLRQALILAAEKSKNSKDQTLESYCIFLADERPELFVSLLGRIIPLQAKLETHGQHSWTTMNFNMPIEEMVRLFQERIRSAYAPTIEHEEDHENQDHQ